MNTLLIVLSVFVLIDALLIIGAILLQEDKSGGGIGIIGGSSQSFLGSNSGSMLSKITTVLVTIFILLIVVMGVISSSFTKGSSISAQDIEAREAQEYELKTKVLTDLPGKITESDFQKNILDKITNESDKTFINEVYTKAQQNKYYELNEKAVKNKDAKVRALGILNGVGYTLEAAPVEVNSVLTNDAADTTND
ncbi:MAG: preprotein translocase subunit SecG [Spirochaetales bacterium]|nr:preprotein translocase subunit SecG [Spirochaetales bacterium]